MKYDDWSFLKIFFICILVLISSIGISILLLIFKIQPVLLLSLEQIKFISESFFYIVVAVVTILTFIQAKNTIFSPMKTEVFKKQIEILGKFERQFEASTSIEDLLHSYRLDFSYDYEYWKEVNIEAHMNHLKKLNQNYLKKVYMSIILPDHIKLVAKNLHSTGKEMLTIEPGPNYINLVNHNISEKLFKQYLDCRNLISSHLMINQVKE